MGTAGAERVHATTTGRWRRRLAWTAAALVALVLLLALAGTALVRGSLPRLEGEASLPGLAAPARLDRDALGVATIEARSPADAMRALGYVHAQERYFEMDLMRRAAAGELAALFGPAAIDTDKRLRVHRMRDRARTYVAQFSAGHHDLLEAYVEGVNAGLDGLDVRPWPYLVLRQVPEQWRIEDSALVGYAMYFDLQDAANARELALWEMQPHLPPALWDLLTHAGSRWDAPLAGEAMGDAVLPDATALDLRLLAKPPAPEPHRLAPLQAPGSNNFAVSGDHTGHGGAIVADDMHLGLRAPNLWFRARLLYPDPAAPDGRVDANGFTLPGLPAVVVGSNGRVAWAFTNSYGDWLDWQQVPACPGPAAPGCDARQWHEERIDVAGGDPVLLEVEETAWGPVIHRDPDGSALALRWVAHQPGALSVGLMDFVHARTVDDVLETANRAAIPAQNLLVGDRDGRIAWRLLGPLPERAGTCDATPPGRGTVLNPASTCPPWPLQSSTGISLADPAEGRLWTANSRVVDGAMLSAVGDGGYALGARALQIRDALRSRDRFDEADLLAIQLDDRALFLERWWRLLQDEAARAGTPALGAVGAAAQEWTGRAAVDAVDYRLVRDWRNEVHARIAEGLTAPAQVALGDRFHMPKLPQLEGVAWPLVEQQPAHLLPARFDSWQALFEDAARALRAEADAAGVPLGQRRWGERNTADICHPLQRALPALTRRWLCMPADPLPGDTDMPRVQAPDFGASERMVVAPGRENEGIAHMPGGQSGHPLSPYWGAGHDDWVHGRPSPFLPGDARHSLQLLPTTP